MKCQILFSLKKRKKKKSDLTFSEKKKKKKKKKIFEIFYFYQKIDLTNVKAHFLGKSLKK